MIQANGCFPEGCKKYFCVSAAIVVAVVVAADVSDVVAVVVADVVVVSLS